ncbi:uncharacterized protein LOC143148619 isoform X2 [Ptiloglossa arizonensis]|uniref:uncharacterized protein LOC143148619 isoform X2 n=1 Tax=Ptiloglossa arizonensis TaxID=3350558 RepID=UPI003FA026E9
MSARSQRVVRETSATKKHVTPRVTRRKTEPKPPKVYDYDVAISKPDIPNFLGSKGNGRKLTVSGVPLRKRALKTRIRSRIMSRKNFQNRSQTLGTKSYGRRNAKTRSTSIKKSNYARNATPSSGVSDEEKDIGDKENVIGNGAVDGEHLSNSPKKNAPTDDENDTTRKAIEDKHRSTEKKLTIEKSECENTAAKSPVLEVRGSRIPRAKVVACPVHEFHTAKKVTINDKVKDTTCAKRSTTALTPDKVNWNEERTSESEMDLEIDEDQGSISSDESSPGIVDDSRVTPIVQNLKLNCPYKSSTEHELTTTNRQEDDSDLKSSSPDDCGKKKWLESLRRRKYVDTSSDDPHVSSDRNNARNQKRSRIRMKVKSPTILRSKTSSLVSASQKTSSRQRPNFSFFNTLFDIVFWPYLFIKAKR